MYASNRPTLGRRMLMTDEREITKDNIIQVVSKAFMEHQENVAEEVYLFEYERGNQPILNREKKIRSDLNATVVENNASKIVDVHLGYCFSNPITFVQRAKIEPTKKQKRALFGFLKKKDEDNGENIDDLKIAMLNKMMQEQSKSAKDIALGRNLFICGVGYQMMLPNRNPSRYSPFELLVPSPLTTFVVYSNDAYREPVLGCTYFIHDDGTITLTAYSSRFCYTIEHELNTTDYHLKENITPNPLRRIPVVEFALNDRMGIFEKVIPLMDAMNLVDSDRINDILQHVQSLLWMHNCQVNEEGKKNLV
ncbi:MAG: phage portal protein, partial [[Ruminococcus] lactaris]|nr:phage portal protein [[Ruminococcus] lactaris]